ncbi:MAG: histidine kinase [Acidobacteriota bacterium]
MDTPAHTPRVFGWWGVALVWMAWGVINVLRFAAMPDISWAQALTYGFPDAIFWAAVTPLLVFVSKRYELRGERRWRHFRILAAVALAVVLVHTAVDAALASVPQWIEGQPGIWSAVFVKVLRYELHTRLLICTLVIGFVHYQIYARRLAEQRSEADRLAAQLSQAKLSHLRSQLRPHFLFNALNSVAASMELSPEVGRRVVRRLGELLRASLRAEENHWIPLEQELDLARAYLEIEQVRFEERLRFEIDVAEPALGWPVPTLLLQPLVENAVTRGIAPKIDGGCVTVRAEVEGERLVLTVEDDGVGLGPTAAPRPPEGSGIGLSNTRDRLATLYPSVQALLRVGDRDGGGVRVRVRLPRPGAPIDAEVA